MAGSANGSLSWGAVLKMIAAALVAAAIAWAASSEVTHQDLRTKIAVQETKTESIERALIEIRATQMRMEDKIDRVLSNLRRPSEP